MSDPSKEKTGWFTSLRKRHKKRFRSLRRRGAEFRNFVLRSFRSLRRTASRNSVEIAIIQLDSSAPSQKKLPPQQEIPVSVASPPDAAMRIDAVAIIEHTPEQRSGTVASTSGEGSESSVRTARLISIESYDKISPVLEVEEGRTTKEFKDEELVEKQKSKEKKPEEEFVEKQTSKEKKLEELVEEQTSKKKEPEEELVEEQTSKEKEPEEELVEEQTSEEKEPEEELVEEQKYKEKENEEELVEKQTSKEKEPEEELVEEQTSKEKKPEKEPYDNFLRVPSKGVQKEQDIQNNNRRSMSSSDNSVINNAPISDRLSLSDVPTVPKDEETENVDKTNVHSLFSSFVYDDPLSPLRSPKDKTYVDRENMTDSDHAFPRKIVLSRSDPGISGYLKEPQPGPSSAGIQAPEFEFAQRPELIGAANEVEVQRPEPEVGVSDDEQRPEVEVVPALFENVDRSEAEGTSETADSNTNTSGVASTYGPHLPGTDELLAQVKKRLQKESGAKSDSEVSLNLSEDNLSEPEPQPSTSRQKDDAEPQPSTSRPQDYYTGLGPIGQREISTSPDDDSLASNISTEPLLGTGKTRKFTKRVTELKHQYSTSSDEGSMRGARPFNLERHHNSPERHVTPEGEEDYIIPPFLFRIRAPEPPPRSPPDGFSASSGIEEDYNG